MTVRKFWILSGILAMQSMTSPLAEGVSAVTPDSPVSVLIGKLRSEVNTEEAMRHMREVYESDRFFTFPAFQKTAEHLAGKLKEIGLSRVELLHAPADGVTQYGFWTMPMAWDAKEARLEIVEPAVSGEQGVLADYPRIPASLGMWSGPTPPDGITAEVVEMAGDSPEEIEKLDMKGKLVLTRFNLLGSTTSSKWIFVKKGALGVINAFTENPELKDGRHWVNFWGDSGWAFTKKSTPLICFSVSPRGSDLLHELLERHGKVVVRAKADTRHYAGTYPYVTAVLPGLSPEEEVLELGHTSEQGANDNAAGVAAMVEAVAALNRLIEAGTLPRPRRSIRILAMGELYPTMHYLATYPERSRNTVAAWCVDTPAAPYELAGTEYSFHLNPDIGRSFIDALTVRIASEYFSKLTPPRPFREAPYGTGTDNFLADPVIGVPTVWPFAGTGIPTHHNSEDTPERVDARSLRDITVVTAAFLYAVASAGDAELPWLAETAASRAAQVLQEDGRRMMDRVFAAPDADALGRLLHRGTERNEYLFDRESQAVRSVLRLIPEGRRAAGEASLAPVFERLRRLAKENAGRLRDSVNVRAKQLGIPTPVEPVAVPHPQAAAASRLVVKRKRMGTIPLDDLPVEQWEGYPYGSWALVPVTSLYWCDGRRNLAEVIRLTGLEHDTAGFDFIGYFRFLARHGYVDLTER